MFNRMYLKTGIALSSIGLGFLSFSKIKEVNAHLKELNKKFSVSKEDGIYTLNGVDYANFPWNPNRESISSYNDWEMKKVRVKGLISDSFFLVGKERRG